MGSASVSSNPPLSVPFDGVSACCLSCISAIPSGGGCPGRGVICVRSAGGGFVGWL